MNRIVYVLMGCAGIAMTAFLVIKEIQSDEKSPVITFDENAVVSYGAGCDSSVLLTGVHVTDNVDGDVSESLVVENVYDFGNGPEPAVYSFDTVKKRGHLHPFSDNKWVYYGWHEGVIFD